MPAEGDHIGQAERNERLYDSLCVQNSSEEFTEWEVVALFYAALHYINACLASMNVEHHDNHLNRNRRVNNIASFAPIRTLYRHLYNSSRNARYDLYNYSPSDVRTIARQFEPIKVHIRNYFGI